MDEPSTRSGGEYVYEALLDAGVELLVGIPGTQTLPLDRVVAARDEMRYVMARHETAIPHVAWGYFETSGTPAATLTVPGPGETTAMHGLKNALEDCVPIVHVAADVDPDDRGKGPIHEIPPDTYDNVVKENAVVTDATDLPAALARGVERALAPPMGPVRLGVPSGVLAAEFAAPGATVTPERVERDNEGHYDEAADLLSDAQRPAIYVGGGVRRSEGAPALVAELADALDAPVATTLKGKGTFPEDDPRFLGVAGSHLPAGAREVLAAADVVLALGTDFDGLTTGGWELPMGDRLVHVDLDPAHVDGPYPSDVGIVDDVAEAAAGIRDRLVGESTAERRSDRDGWDGASVASAVREEYREHLSSAGAFDDGPPMSTPSVLRTVRGALPDDAVVTTDVGGFRLWAMQLFETHAPEEYVSAGSWAGMGVGLPAAIGAKLARPDRPVVCLSGDGGLLMCVHELHTAAEEGIDVTVVVSNNEDYGVISKKPQIRGVVDDHAFAWSSPDFAALAESFGWTGTSVATADALADALDDALARDGPTLVDVDVATDEPSAAEAAEYESELSF